MTDHIDVALPCPDQARALNQAPMSAPDTGWSALHRRARGLPAIQPAPPSCDDHFDPALRGDKSWRVDDDGHRESLPALRWHGEPEEADRELLDRCNGPTIDIGCGPGRLTAALSARGLAALGIDTSPVAIDLTRRRGATALHRDVFAPLPGEGRWRHVLLFDGNIGIGGDPVVLLRRCASLLQPGGTVLVELAAPGTGLWRGAAQVEHAGKAGPVFPWARVGADAVQAAAARAELTVRAVRQCGDRWFAELMRS